VKYICIFFKHLLILLFILIVTYPIYSQDTVTFKTLPFSNLMELDKEKINQEGNTYPGGWSEFYNDYCVNTGFYFEREKAKPFHAIGVYPYTKAMNWVEGMMYKELLSKNMEWVEDYFVYNSLFPKKLGFQVLFEVDALQVPTKDKPVFIYEDSTGYRTMLKYLR